MSECILGVVLTSSILPTVLASVYYTCLVTHSCVGMETLAGPLICKHFSGSSLCVSLHPCLRPPHCKGGKCVKGGRGDPLPLWLRWLPSLPGILKPALQLTGRSTGRGSLWFFWHFFLAFWHQVMPWRRAGPQRGACLIQPESQVGVRGRVSVNTGVGQGARSLLSQRVRQRPCSQQLLTLASLSLGSASFCSLALV